MNSRLGTPATALRVAVGLMDTLAGLDKFFNLLADWPSYIAPLAVQFSPVSPATMMGVVGIVEFAVGITILAIRPALGAYVASAWLTLVALNLILGAHFDIAVRDLVLAVAAFTLARLEEVRAEVATPITSAAQPRRPVTA